MHNVSKKLLSLLCAAVLLVAMVPLSALPVAAGKALPHRTETTLLEKIIERDGFIEGIWYPWFTHTYLGCGLTSNELAAKWLNGWSGVTNCWYDFKKVGIDEYGADKIYQEIYNLKSLGYNMLGYEGSIYGEGVIYDDYGDVIGIKDEYLYNVRRFLDMCRDIGMPVLWTVTCHTSSVHEYYTNGKHFWDVACRFYADPVVADHYAERFVKPLCKVLAEYPDVVAMVASTSEAENEMNDTQVGNLLDSKTRGYYGVSQENMVYFVNAVTEAVKAAFPSVPRTICCQMEDMSIYSEVDFDLLGDQNYNWAGRSDAIEGFRSPVPMIVSEFGMGDEYTNISDTKLTEVQLTFRENFRKTGYQGCFMWCWSSTGTGGSSYDLLKKGAKNVTDFRSTAYELYYYFEEQRDIHRGDKTVLDTPQLFCNTGNGLLEWVAPRQATRVDILRSDDGGKTWTTEVKNGRHSDYVLTGNKGQYFSDATPTANTVYKIVVRDDKGNEKSSQASNSSADMKKFNTKYSGSKEDNKTYNIGTFPMNLSKVSAVIPIVLDSVVAGENRPSSAAANLIKDGSFESGNGGFTTSGVLKVVSDKTAPDGGKSLYFDTSSTDKADWHILWLDVTPNTDYVFSTWIKGAHLSADNRGYATIGVVDSENKRFLTGGSYFFTQSQQIVPTGWDEAWHLRAVSFNSGSRKKIGIALYGCSSQMWVDGLALYKKADGTSYQSENMSYQVSTRVDVEYTYCSEKNCATKNPTMESTSSTYWQTGSGWDSGFLSIAKNKYEYGASLKYTATANPVGQQYIKWVDVEPNTWYVFSADVKILKSGEGSLIVVDGKRRNPDNVSSLSFDGDSLGYDWLSTTYRFKTGPHTRIGIGVVDGGGSALIDNLRLFKAADGVAGDDAYKDPNTGSAVAPPTAVVKPTGQNTTAVGTTTEPSATVTDPAETNPTTPVQDETSDPTAPVAEDIPAGPTEDKPKTTAPWLYIAIGGGVLLVGGGVALLLFLRKKKA